MNNATAKLDATRARELVFLAAADARRMEAAEEYGALRYAQAMRPGHPEWGAEWEEFAGGHLVFVAKNALVGRAHGLGFTGAVTPEDIEHVENFYFERQSDAQVDVCPYADPSLFQSLNQRGFQVEEFNQTLARWITTAEPEQPNAPAPEGIEIRSVRSTEAGTWSALLACVFFGEEQAKQFEGLFHPWATPEHPLSLAAFVDGRMVATAGGVIVREQRMAGFFGAATLPEFRRRGIQQAFMRARLRIAQQAGCDLAVTLTMPGTTSQRNVERAGFRTAYTKVVVRKRHPSVPDAGPPQVQYSA
jgi:GNAT superfamily N-acetyltransferase